MPPIHVAVLGGGLAGMSAAIALAQEGCRVTLIEKRAVLGGRAGSHVDATTGECVDNCQHVLMPCCTNLLDFYRRIGAREKIRFYPEIPFIESEGRVSFLRSCFLPAPLHCTPSFLRLPFLSLRDKWRISLGLVSLLFWREKGIENGSALDWLRARRQSQRSIEDFWQPVLVSALNEGVDKASIRYAAKVFLDAFLSHPRGWWLGIPSVPLSVLYGASLVSTLENHQGQVLLQREVRELAVRNGQIVSAALSQGENVRADAFVLALPWQAAPAVMPEEIRALAMGAALEKLDPSPITGVHLWFDRVVTHLAFAALPGKQVHWFFNKTRTFDGSSSTASYLQLVTSASRAWMGLTKSQILEIALRELQEVLPEARDARVLKSLVLKEPLATFSPSSENERFRPGPETTMRNLFLAGDWIQTGWPATMEGAVRGGYLAAQAVLRAQGLSRKILVPDLAPSGFMRFLRRPEPPTHQSAIRSGSQFTLP